MNALDDLVNKPSGDLRPQFVRFSENLEHLIKAENRTQVTGQEMQHRHADYFALWDKQLATMSYEVVRQRSQERKTEVTNHFETVKNRYQEAQSAVQPLIFYLQDVRTALGADLTSGGLDSVKPIVSNAGQNAEKVKTALAQLSAELAASSTQMSSMIATAQNAP
jgi:recombinational DNA repair ATPase RecF